MLMTWQSGSELYFFGWQVSALEGIIDDDVDKTIQNLAAIGREGMTQTDNMILKIMTSK